MAGDDVEELTKLAPDATQVCGYVEELTLELAGMASRVGETGLAAALALVSIQAASAKRLHQAAA
jgi:hypothetical protein